MSRDKNKCYDCTPPHLWSSHAEGRGCRVPGCCCQAEAPKWQCQYHDSKGVRCTEPAVQRIHFAKDHPFDFMDLCEEHLKFHPGYIWKQMFGEEGELIDANTKES